MIPIGAVFPQYEIPPDPVAIRDYAQAVEGLGFSHLVAYDHVLGAATADRPDWSGPYTDQHAFHEPFVLFGYLAGVTSRLGLTTGVIVLPQRQTALVAKQAAQVDVLSGGRMRFGLGVGWNAVEYEALGEDFNTRGRRSAEQVRVLRALWTDPVVSFAGRWHTITQAGLNPMPVQRPIPIWFGGHADATLRRVARLGDGWFPTRGPGEEAKALTQRLNEEIDAAGRGRSEVGVEARLQVRSVVQGEWEGYAEAWRRLGATSLAIDTMGAGNATVDAHLTHLTRVARTFGLSG